MLAACGGGGGGLPGGGGGGGGNGVPTASVLAPVLGVAAMLGDSFTFSFVSNDDGAAAVRVIADADLDLGTTADQVVLFIGVDGDGARQDLSITCAAPLVPGDYTLFLDVADGVNPPVQIVLPRPLIVYPGIAGVALPRSNRIGVVGDTVIFSRGEAEDVAGALNGDGAADDGVMVSYDVSTGTMTQSNPAVSMDVTGAAGGDVRVVRQEGGTLAWMTLEADEGVSLNLANFENPLPPVGGADIDMVDTMISYVVPASSLTPRTNTYGGPTAIVAMENGLIVVHYLEAGEGTQGLGGTDLNGDLDVLDAMLGYVDPAGGGATYEFNQIVFYNQPPANIGGPQFRSAGVNMAAMMTTEVGSAPGTDFNGDADQLDTYLLLLDMLIQGGTGVPGTVLGIGGFQAAPSKGPSAIDPTAAFDVSADGHAAYYLDEGANNLPPGGAAGNDVNADLIIGHVPAIYDVNTQTELIPAGIGGPVNAVAGSATMIYDGTRVFFTGAEAPRLDPAIGTNGDGDGGADQAILYWSDHTAPGPVPPAQPLAVAFGGIGLQALSLDMGGSVTRLSPAWLAVIVNEAANGGAAADINGSGAIDMAYLLVRTDTNPAPTVFNPQVVPSAAGTFPLAGIYGEDPLQGNLGVVLRLTEAANGDLDGDANGTDTFFGFISFLAPTQVTLLDAGGNHAAVAEGRIGVTADESLTGADYDGSGGATDYLFRVFDFGGNVIEPGLPCSVRSAPVTETGEVWAYLRDEAVEDRFLNADGDKTDLVLGLWIP